MIHSGDAIIIEFRCDGPENRHFIQDFQIISISLVLSDTEDGKQKQWKSLEDVWNLLQNEKGFAEYVQKEVRAWL